MVWITGGPGTGKSTLRDAILDPLAGGALVSIADATAAGIWQRLGWATLPVAVDELEAEADSRRQLNVVKLARLAASGGLVLRGGSDHKEAQFTARSAFLFSSILIPPLPPADRSRIVILELGSLGDRPRPSIAPGRLTELGRLIRTRLVQGWPRLEALREWYRAEGWQGTPRLEARACDLYGTLLAVAEILLADDREELAHEPAQWLDLVRREAAQIQGEARDEDECLAHLLSSIVQVSPSDRKTIAQLVHVAADRGGGDPVPAQRLLGTCGLRVEGIDGVQHLAIANKHQGLVLLFSQTHWGTRSGSSAPWVQAFRRLAARMGGGPSPRLLWFGGVASRATILPLEKCLPVEHNPAVEEHS